MSRPGSLQRTKISADQASMKQKRIEQVAMNHKNMRKMLNDERKSNLAGRGERVGPDLGP